MKRIRSAIHKIQHGTSRERGQGLVEFALIFPILILVIMSMLEFGLYFMTYLTVQNASREAARMASTLSFLEEDDSRVLTFVNGYLPTAGPFQGFAGGTSNTAVADCEINDQITVTITGQYSFVALGFVGLDGIDLSFPSTTHYELCGAYIGSTEVPNPTNTSPATSTSAVTDTPSPTPTFTASPTSSCGVSGGALVYDWDDLRWNLTNNGSSTERIASVYFEWVDSPYYNYWDHMRFGGDIIHYGDDSSPPTYVSGGWYGWDGRRDISPSQTRELDLDFAYGLPGYGASITVTFESGCVVSTSGGGSPSNTPSATNTLAATNTPTPTDTPTPSKTPTATATVSCSIQTISAYYSGDDLLWTIRNNGGSTERISVVSFNWVDSPYYNYYDQMYFGGYLIHEGNDDDPPTSVSGGWYGSGFRRDIDPGETLQLDIDFRYSIPTYGASISITFESGCSIGVP